ncbi:2-oxoglutarate dehydrogenase E1 component [Prolixibacteraceae bacterium JC049]|nr:2-oxoglutarate dehydrogenase E1 component [Prolixibacteraceae bacterium JC049]
MDKFSQVGNQEIASIEQLYQSYLENPNSIDQSWKSFFEGFEFARKNYNQEEVPGNSSHVNKEFKVLNLIQGYRQRGHLFTQTNPVRTRRKYEPTLDLETFGLEKSDLKTIFQAGNNIGIGPSTLEKIIEHLQATYCNSVGVEYLYMRHPEVVAWLQEKMESSRNGQDFAAETRKHIFYHLKLAVGFENYIHKKFVGQKRFSLEGAESLIPALDAVIERGSELGIKEFIVGMAHRGRLNILANILEKPYKNIFNEFLGKEYEDDISLGDVKYHLGFENEITTDKGKHVHLSLLPNPSHLEAVSPLVEGMSRSRIDSKYNGDFTQLAPIVIHGDAAIAGQGVVYEVAQMSQLKGYRTGGTIHLVINNQVGFTTNYLEARSSTYCTDVAKVNRSPVFHVNGDDPEALVYTIKLAMEFRQKFNADVFIDLLCYRKHGHNEGDEPRFTQPTLYNSIARHPNPRDIYAERLVNDGIMTKEEVKHEIAAFNQLLEEKYNQAEMMEKVNIRHFLNKEYNSFDIAYKNSFNIEVDTTFDKAQLLDIGKQINTLPGDLKFFKKVHKLVGDRLKMLEKNQMDWAMAELLAYGSLVKEGYPVRVSGQDSERGTFSHRHAAFVVEDTDMRYYPLKHISNEQAPFHVFNSPLNEYGVLGFEYGYALAQPNALTIWEAQFGDFSNVAQVIFDQYISSASEKWGMMNNVVLFLPHGYEGQGPEHSSARIERILALTASNNMQVMNLTTPANLFHALRRNVKWNYRLPMIIFTPKSLLRHPEVKCTIEDLAEGQFMEVIDNTTTSPSEITDVVFTMGKLYFDLKKTKEELGQEHVALVRLEQLYPLPIEKIEAVLSKYKNAKRLVWAQDEPANMGAWPFIQRYLSNLNFEVVARPASGSPAGGLMEQHIKREQNLLKQIFKTEVLS